MPRLIDRYNRLAQTWKYSEKQTSIDMKNCDRLKETSIDIKGMQLIYRKNQASMDMKK